MTRENGTLGRFSSPDEKSCLPTNPREGARRRAYQTPTLVRVANMFDIVGKGAGTEDPGHNTKPGP
jgi:hypothetical protein